MAKGSTTISDQNAARTMQMATEGVDWMRKLVEQSFDQAAATFEAFLTSLRRTGSDFDYQAKEVRERSMSLASETMSNALNFVHKLMRAREPQEIIQLQSEFVTQQARAFAEYSNVLGENIARKAEEAGKMGARDIAELSRRSSEAA
jgi:hypothetical protein